MPNIDQTPSPEALVSFAARFEALTGYPPFPWQGALFERLAAGDIPSRCDIPTGLGKTSVIAIWLLALAAIAEKSDVVRFPRRLVYVVNRRTIVDQATREAEVLRRKDRLGDPRLHTFWTPLRTLGIRDARELDHLLAPLAISTLRGQFADNAEWRADPARPAIIVGTVDMIGSRLLFSGYGRGFKTRPMHAGFLGQDTLVVHDEAHLEPAFQELLTAIERAQRDGGAMRDGFGRMRVMALTATSRAANEQDPSASRVFALGDADHQHPVVKKRLFAKKRIAFHRVDEKKVVDRLAELALKHGESGQAILVFVRKVEDVQKLMKKLPSGRSLPLTGTIRGLERDQLKTNAIFARFDPKPEVKPLAGTVYLVCTSAGEVGIDVSADHLVCDLTPFDSMAQRFGRVNRFGEGDARIDVMHAVADEEVDEEGDGAKAFENARVRTLALFRALPRVDERYDASPAALSALPADARRRAFTPAPTILPVTDVLFDAWALTSILGQLPGRPAVADWLHGVADWEPPQTQVAWREEVERGRVPATFDRRKLLEAYPLKPHELLRDATKRVFEELKDMASRVPDAPAWIVDGDGAVVETTLGDIQARGKDDTVRDTTVILPPSAGGLDVTGLLRGTEGFRDDGRYDVADEWKDENGRPRRIRLEAASDEEDQRDARRGMRLVLAVPPIAPEEADEGDAGSGAIWRWYVQPASSDGQGSRTAPHAQTLGFHLGSAEHFAREIARALGLPEPEAKAVVCSARFHDLGKERRLWQRSIGNDNPEKTMAKSDGRRTRAPITKYRHELGSLFDVESEPEFGRLDEEAKDLVLHAIAAHHGRARPCFASDEVFDPAYSDAACAALAREVPRRFARLQRKYGRWGLAYLESLVRAADVLASLEVEPENDAPAETGERAALRDRVEVTP